MCGNMQSLDKSVLPKIYKLQAQVAKLAQIDIPIRHYHANGFYAREMRMPAGVILIGKTHASEHLCFISKGKALVASEEFSGEVEAGYLYVSKPGAKRAITALEDLIWTTVHMTDKTDLVELEEELIMPDIDID